MCSGNGDGEMGDSGGGCRGAAAAGAGAVAAAFLLVLRAAEFRCGVNVNVAESLCGVENFIICRWNSPCPVHCNFAAGPSPGYPLVESKILL
jgi:hypothetical protein